MVSGGLSTAGAMMTAKANAEAQDTTPIASWGHDLGQGKEADEAAYAASLKKRGDEGAAGGTTPEDAAAAAQAQAVASAQGPMEDVINTARPPSTTQASSDPAALMAARGPNAPTNPGVIDNPGANVGQSLMPNVSQQLLSGRSG